MTPRSLRSRLQRLALWLNRINTSLLLGSLYLLLICPLGWLLRRTGALPHARPVPASPTSLRQPVDRVLDAKAMERPY